MAIREFEEILPDTHPSSYVDDTALVIGDVVIGANSSIWPLCIIRGDVNYIRIGENTNIQDHGVLHVTHDGPHSPSGYPLLIGNNVTVGHRVTLHGCQVMDRCLIGMDTTLMDGVVVQPCNMIAAGSLVTPGKELESGYLWMGRPARRIRALTADEVESIDYLAQHYVRLKKRHQAS